MCERLIQKTEEYEQLLADACGDAEIRPPGDTQRGELAAEHLEMAEAYLADGRHFFTADDLPNALASFAYGHGWLDAARRSGLIGVPEDPSDANG